MVYLDLAELDEVFRERWLWSADRFNAACFNRAYHLGDLSVPLEKAVRDLVEERLGRRQAGPVRLLTQMRYFGFNYSPVSFYYCFDKDGRRVETIVVEIRNTPWGEQFCYVLGEEQNDGMEKDKKFLFSKTFHISPFMDMDIRYKWEFADPENAVHILMTSYAKEVKIFDAELSMERREISGPTLCHMLVKYPFLNIKILGAIYWQAFCLKTKGAKFYAHPLTRTNSGESKLL